MIASGGFQLCRTLKGTRLFVCFIQLTKDFQPFFKASQVFAVKPTFRKPLVSFLSNNNQVTEP